MFASTKIWVKVFVTLSILLVAVSAFGFYSFRTSAAGVQGPPPDPLFAGQPRVVHFPKKFAATNSTQAQLPNWSSSFTYGGQTYNYTMVGTDPSKGSATTTIPVTIIPLKLTFSNGTSFDGTQKVQSTVSSPIFKTASFISGKTQYGDAIQRAEFWSIISKMSPNYHVLLGNPTVATTVSLTVPAASGKTKRDRSGKTIGVIDLNWFDPQLQSLLASSQFNPNMLPIFLANNVYLYQGSLSQGILGGYHSVATTSAGLQTYLWATNADPKIQGGFGEDVSTLSHELSEWFNDPFLGNVVPNWISPIAPIYGCNNILEDGDPLVGVVFTVAGFKSSHLQDEAFFSWFARQSPSIAIHGLYTYLGTFKKLSKVC